MNTKEKTLMPIVRLDPKPLIQQHAMELLNETIFEALRQQGREVA